MCGEFNLIAKSLGIMSGGRSDFGGFSRFFLKLFFLQINGSFDPPKLVGVNRGEMGRSLVTTRGMGNVVAR